MPRNVEIKAKVTNINKLLEKAEKLSNFPGEIIKQEDTFFMVPKGRLKLRHFQDGSGELIFYERPDSEGPKTSTYTKSAVSEPNDLQRVLTDALGVKGTVKKTRWLFLVGQTRVHVDEVENLGNFMELEVMLMEDQAAEEGQAIANRLMTELGVSQSDLLSGAYMDMLLQK